LDPQTDAKVGHDASIAGNLAIEYRSRVLEQPGGMLFLRQVDDAVETSDSLGVEF
jgi:hypothetical protein